MVHNNYIKFEFAFISLQKKGLKALKFPFPKPRPGDYMPNHVTTKLTEGPGLPCDP